MQTVDRNGRNRDVATVVLPKDHSKEPSVVVVTTHPNEPATVTRQRKIDLSQITKADKPKPAADPGPPPVHWVDYVSRALFPGCYFLFLTSYWLSNINAAANEPKP